MKKLIQVTLLWCAAVTVPAQSRAAINESRVILTPKPSAVPRINGARVFGVRPNHPFLFTIAATGERPLLCGAKFAKGARARYPIRSDHGPDL